MLNTANARRLLSALMIAGVAAWALAARTHADSASSPGPTAQTLSAVNSVAGFGGAGRNLWATTSSGGLYLTTNGGASWAKRVAPVSLTGLATGSYGIAQSGRSLVWLVAPARGTETLFRSDNDGRTWSVSAAVPSVRVPSYARPGIAQAQVYVQLLDSHVGVVVLDQFLTAFGGYWTLDESTTSGRSFTTTRLPTFGPVQFGSAADGYLAGGPGDQDVYRTSDNGRYWTKLNVTPPVSANFTAAFPLSATPATAVVPVTVTMPSGATRVYSMRVPLPAQGERTQAAKAIPRASRLNISGSAEQVAIASRAGVLFAVAPNGSRVYTSDDGGARWAVSASHGLPSGVESVIYTRRNGAIAEVDQSSCASKSSCEFHTSLFTTTNGGLTWSALNL
jgi:hypothetical protein